MHFYRIMLAVLLLLVAIPTTHAQPGQSAAESAAADAEVIRGAIRAQEKAIRERNVNALMAHYSKDILVSYPGVPDTDYQGFYEGYRQMLTPRPGITTVTVSKVEEVVVSGDLAMVRMNWETTITETQPAKTSLRRARDLQVWRREDGGWKFYRGMWYHLKPADGN